jgi:hypothetical protein
MVTIPFNITYQFISLFAKKESKFFPLYHFSIVNSDFFFFEYLLFCLCGGDLTDLLPVLLSESDNYALTICTSTHSQNGDPVKLPQQYKAIST